MKLVTHTRLGTGAVNHGQTDHQPGSHSGRHDRADLPRPPCAPLLRHADHSAQHPVPAGVARQAMSRTTSTNPASRTVRAATGRLACRQTSVGCARRPASSAHAGRSRVLLGALLVDEPRRSTVAGVERPAEESRGDLQDLVVLTRSPILGPDLADLGRLARHQDGWIAGVHPGLNDRRCGLSLPTPPASRPPAPRPSSLGTPLDATAHNAQPVSSESNRCSSGCCSSFRAHTDSDIKHWRFEAHGGINDGVGAREPRTGPKPR